MSDQEFFKNDDPPYLVKTFDSYGINIINSYTDVDLLGKKINSSPLVQFYNSFTKAIFDYSNTESENDLEYISILLQGLTNGNTFTISNGYYVKDQDGITSNINGVYQFDGSQNDNLILTSVISNSGLNTAESRYERDYFVESPQFTLNSGFTGDPYFVVKSMTNYGVVENLGAVENDLIEISYAGNTANIDRYRIEKIETSSENEEIIFLKDSVNNDNRLGQKSTINLYVRGIPPITLAEIDQSINGCAKTYTVDGNYLECFENQNELQAYLRRFKYEQSNVLNSWTEDCNCTGFTAGYQTDGLNYDAIYSLKIENNNYFVTGYYTDLVSSENPTLNLSEGIFKFDQSHFSNYSEISAFEIVFAETLNDLSNEDYLNIFTNNYVAGTETAYTLLTISSSTPRSFYYSQRGNPSVYGIVNVN